MSLKALSILGGAAAIYLGTATLIGCPALAKTWTVDDRQVQLMKDINAGQKAGELTLKEAEKLRSDLADVSRKKAKMKAKANGKLTADDKLKLESDINKISTDIRKLKLEKRLQVE